MKRLFLAFFVMLFFLSPSIVFSSTIYNAKFTYQDSIYQDYYYMISIDDSTRITNIVNYSGFTQTDVFASFDYSFYAKDHSLINSGSGTYHRGQPMTCQMQLTGTGISLYSDDDNYGDSYYWNWGIGLSANDSSPLGAPTPAGATLKLDAYEAVISPVPEPTTMLLFGLGLISFAGISRKKQ